MNNLARNQPPVFPVDRLVIPEAVTLYLKNGIPVYMIESGSEEVLRLEFTFRAGQVKESLPLQASTTNMMLSEGTMNYRSEELNRLIDYYGAFINFSVDKDRAGIVIFLLNKHLDKILELCCEMLFMPSFPEPELNSLLTKRMRWYMVNREKVQNLASDKFFESVFGKQHQYGRIVVEEDFQKISQKKLRDFHSKYYTPDNMAVIISGKFLNDTCELLEHHLGKIKGKEQHINPGGSLIKGENNKAIHVEKTGSIQSAIRIGSTTINKRHRDYQGLKIVNSILGGYFSSRLMKNIREDKGFTYGIGSSVSSLDLTGYFMISCEVSNKNCKKVIDEIYREIQLLQSIPVEKEELTVVRNYMSGEMLRMFDGPFAQAESFKSSWEFGLDNTYYYKLAEKIKTISPDEIIELARTYYNIGELYQVTAGSR
jgi:zinc protease